MEWSSPKKGREILTEGAVILTGSWKARFKFKPDNKVHIIYCCCFILGVFWFVILGVRMSGLCLSVCEWRLRHETTHIVFLSV